MQERRYCLREYNFYYKVASDTINKKIVNFIQISQEIFFQYKIVISDIDSKMKPHLHLLSLENDPDPRSPIIPGCLGPATFLFNWRKEKKIT